MCRSSALASRCTKTHLSYSGYGNDACNETLASINSSVTERLSMKKEGRRGKEKKKGRISSKRTIRRYLLQ